MKKLTRWISLLLVVGLVISLAAVSGSAERTLSAAYPEATELLMNIDVLDEDKSWTEPISGAEAKAALRALGVSEAFDEGAETVSGAALLNKALESIGYAVGNDTLWANFNHLLKGVAGYSASGAITREQTAQILLNTLKALPNGSGEIKGASLGLSYVLTGRDEFNRPYYKWSNGSDLTAIYKDTPVYYGQGGISYCDLLTAIGVPAEINRWTMFNCCWNGNGFNGYWDKLHWGDTPHSGCGGDFLASKGNVIEVYDDYCYVNVNGNSGRAYSVSVIETWLAEVRDDGLYVYGESNGATWGPWELPAGKSKGYYIMWYSWKSGAEGYYRLEPAGSVRGLLWGWDDWNTNIYADDQKTPNSQHFFFGNNLKVYPDNQYKVYTFLLDEYGNVIGMREAPLTPASPCQTHTWTNYRNLDEIGGQYFHGESWTYYNLHERECTVCHAVEQGAHVAGDPVNVVEATEDAGGYTGDIYCTCCGVLMQSGTDTPPAEHRHVAGEAQQENYTAATCEQDGSYDMVARCTECTCPLSSQHYTIPAIGHDWEQTGRTEPTESEDGSVTYICRNDPAHTKNEVLYALGKMEEPAEKNGATAYPEAVELLTNVGVMQKTAEWSKKITGIEANKAFEALGVVGGFRPTGTVTGEAFLAKALEAIGYNVGNDTLWATYNHLTKGVSGYSGSAELTREQAAQILLNTLKSFKNDSDSMKAADLGLTYVRTGEDAFHRPSYKWQKNGKNVTASYTDAPVVVVKGGTCYCDLLKLMGVTDENNRWMLFNCAWNGNAFQGYWEKLHWGDPAHSGCGGDTIGSIGETVEIYDNYGMAEVNSNVGRAYLGVIVDTWLAEIRMNDNGLRYIQIFGKDDGTSWGWWYYNEIQNLSDGYYYLNYSWNGKQEGVYNRVTASGVTGTLDAWNDATVTVSGTVLNRNKCFLYGKDLLTAENLGKTFTFLQDNDGNVLGMQSGVLMLQGNNQKYYTNDGEASVRAAFPLSAFTGTVTMDGEPVDPANYTVSEGSTIITFKESYMKSLPVGTHRCGVDSTFGTAYAAILVTGSVRTGDPAHLVLWISLLGISAAAAFVLLRRKQTAK